jgi:hypothetical protein
MSELDWIVEQEELPPDEPYTPAPEPQLPRRCRIPLWLWVAGGILVLTSAIVAPLWILGGKDNPLPPPDPELAALEAAVELEIGALNSGDREIYERQQDSSSRRRNYQPPPDVWFAAEERQGQLELIDLRPLGIGKARADTSLEWNGTFYRLVWFYRRDGDRWLHTDWVPGQLTTTLTLTTTHLTVEYHPEEAREAAALAERTEQLISGLCNQLRCLGEPIRLTIAFDPLHVDPAVDENGNYFRLPSPVRFRWPLNGEPEPMVMGSLARHLATRLLVPPASAGISPENRDALSLIIFWLAHDLMDLETLPGTAWLDEVEAREGMAAVAALGDTIQTGVPPQEAVRERLLPETVAAVTREPGYLTWLALIADPIRLLSAYDSAANPWAPAGQGYRAVWPELVDVVYRGEWAVGITDPESVGPAMVFFRQGGGDWHAFYPPDESLIGERRQRVAGPFAITYYEWDEEYIEPLVEMLVETYEKVAANFGLEDRTTYEVAVMPYPSFPAGSADIFIKSPTLKAAVSQPPISDEEFMLVAGTIFGRAIELGDLPEERTFMLIGLFLWQVEDLGHSPDRWYRMIGSAAVEDWRPPKTVDDEAWLPLAQLWQIPVDEPSEDLMAQYLWSPYLLIKYVVEVYGRDQVRVMVTGLATAGSVEAWIAEVTDQSLDEFEMAWRQWVMGQWGG